MPDLLLMDHIRLGEDRTSSCNPDRVIALESEVPKGFDGDPDPGGLLIQKRSCAGCTDRIHGKIDDNAISQDDHLGILAADFNNGLCRGENVDYGNGVSGDLVLDEISPYQISG